MSSDTYYVAQPDVIECTVDNNLALLHLPSNTYFELNPTAAEIWPMLAEPRTLDALVALVTEEFDVSDAECRPEIAAMIAQMLDAQVLQTQPES